MIGLDILQARSGRARIGALWIAVLGFPLGLAGQGALPEGSAAQVRNAVSVERGVQSGPELGVWVWSRADLLASPALTLPDLLGEIPGIVLVRGGDLGAPVGIAAFGQGAGLVRVFLDGIEERPVESGAVDLAGVSMVGLEEVRVERGISEVRIYLRTHQADDPRPSTLLDVATGDLRTNLFRVGFVHPSVAGGSLLVALDRADTDGPGQDERGALYGTRFQYAFFPRDDLSVALDFRSRTARRPGTDRYLPDEVNRSELRLRLGWDPRPGLRTQIHASRLRASGIATGSPADTLLLGQATASAGLNLEWQEGPFRVWGAGSVQESLGLPQDRIEAGAEFHRDAWGGIALRLDREGWAENAKAGRSVDGDPVRDAEALGSVPGTGGWSVKAWSAPLLGISLFGEVDRAARGVPFVVGPDVEVPPPSGSGDDVESSFRPRGFLPLEVSSRDGLRVGARMTYGGLDLTGAWFRVEADTLQPLGLTFDRRGPWRPGGDRSGYEIMGRLSLSPLLEGLSLSGSGTFWGEGGGEEGIGSPWAYLPERAWTGRMTWYRTGYDGKFESWVDLGVRGRDGMVTSLPDRGGVPAEVGFSQNWYTRIQVRVATVRVFLLWDNLAFRDENADLPDRFLPQTRAVYGIRWTMWN